MDCQELVQNAEDAKASRIQFILDERQFGTDNLMVPADGKEGFEKLQVGVPLSIKNLNQFKVFFSFRDLVCMCSTMPSCLKLIGRGSEPLGWEA